MSADALNSTNTALGSVMMATQYNTYQTPFANKAEMENHAYAMSCKPSEDMIHPIECDPHQSSITTFFVRGGTVPDGADKRLYDLGRFEIGTVGFQGASVNIGELHVTYQVSLMKPRLYVALNQSLPFYHVALLSGAWSGTQPLGTLPPPTTSSTNMAVTFSYVAGAGYTDVVIVLPPTASPLFYSIEYHCVLTGLSTAVCRGKDFLNCTDFTAGYYPLPVSEAWTAPEVSIGANHKVAVIAVQVDGLYKVPSVTLRVPDSWTSYDRDWETGRG